MTLRGLSGLIAVPHYLPAFLNDFATPAAPLKASMACREVMARVVCTLVMLPPAIATKMADAATVSSENPQSAANQIRRA